MRVFAAFLFVVGVAYSQTVTPKHATLTGEEDETVTIGCDVAGMSGNYKPLKWYRKGAELVIEGEKYQAHEGNNTLEINNAEVSDSGAYSCVAALDNGNSYNATVYISGGAHVKPFERSKNLVQDDPLTVDCHVEGYPDPSVQWTKDGADLDISDPRISTNPLGNVPNATLKIMELKMEDAGEYTCIASNSLGTGNSTLTVRVKDKLAALWPFLGIVAEVVILCVIIFIYERRRAKKMEEEDTPEESGRLTNSHDHKGKDEIRQRK